MEASVVLTTMEVVPFDDECMCSVAFFSTDTYLAMSRFWDDQDDGLYVEYGDQSVSAKDCVLGYELGAELVLRLAPLQLANLSSIRIGPIPVADRPLIDKVMRVLLAPQLMDVSSLEGTDDG